MQAKKSSIDPPLKVFSLLKRIASLLILLSIFYFCVRGTYNRTYGDNHRLRKLENLLANGKTTIAQFDAQYTSTQTRIGSSIHFTYEFGYAYSASNKMYNDTYVTSSFIPKEADALVRFSTVHYLPDDPETKAINIQEQIEEARLAVDDHSVWRLMLNIFGLLITPFIILTLVFGIRDIIKNFDKPIEIPEYLKPKTESTQVK